MGRHEVPRRSVWLVTALLGAAGILGSMGTAAAQVDLPDLPVVSQVTVPPVTVPPVTVPPVELPVEPPEVNLPPLPVTVPGLPGAAAPSTPSSPARAAPDAPAPGAAGPAPPVAGPAPAEPAPAGGPSTQVAGEAVDRAVRSHRPSLAQAAEVLPAFWLPLAIGLLILGFLLIQGQLDRRDPKLATAPLTDEVLPFS